MTIYYLCVKVHKLTGLRYLCQTKRNPFKYLGSGVAWTMHLAKYGPEHDTFILHECSSKEERNNLGRYYSNLWHVVTASDDFGNKIWANLIPETGGGGGRKAGSYTEEEKLILSERMKGIKNPMNRKDVIRKKSGANHFTHKADYDSSLHPMKRPEVKQLVSGKNSIRYNHSIYRFINSVTLEEVSMTQRDFINHYKLCSSSVSRLISGKYKQLFGWRLERTVV